MVIGAGNLREAATVLGCWKWCWAQPESSLHHSGMEASGGLSSCPPACTVSVTSFCHTGESITLFPVFQLLKGIQSEFEIWGIHKTFWVISKVEALEDRIQEPGYSRTHSVTSVFLWYLVSWVLWSVISKPGISVRWPKVNGVLKITWCFSLLSSHYCFVNTSNHNIYLQVSGEHNIARYLARLMEASSEQPKYHLYESGASGYVEATEVDHLLDQYHTRLVLGSNK